MLFGYARVSGADQNPAHQVDALARAGVGAENIHLDHAGGAKASRPQLDVVLARLRGGDTLVITRLDRLGRSVLHLITLGAQLRERGIELKVLDQGIDTATAEGRAMFGMLSVLAELQRELIVANTRDGLAAARARGRKGGRPPKLTDDQIALAQRLYDAGENTVAQIAAMLNVPRTTIYGHLSKKNTSAPSQLARPAAETPATAFASVRVPRTCPTCGYEPSTRAGSCSSTRRPGSCLAPSECRRSGIGCHPIALSPLRTGVAGFRRRVPGVWGRADPRRRFRAGRPMRWRSSRPRCTLAPRERLDRGAVSSVPGPCTRGRPMIESAPQLPEQRETLDGDALNHALAAMRTVLDGALAGVSGARDVLLATQAGGDFESGQGNGGEIALDLYLAHAAADLRTALSLIRDQLRDGL